MTDTLERARGVVLINVFTVEPANQPRLIDLLTHATEGSVNRAPGFISATLHRSIDDRELSCRSTCPTEVSRLDR